MNRLKRISYEDIHLAIATIPIIPILALVFGYSYWKNRSARRERKNVSATEK